MHFSHIAAISALATAASAAVVRSPVPDAAGAPAPPLGDGFYLKTQLKGGQTDKAEFENLYLYAYHTGAGLSDAMLTPNQSIGNLAVAQPGAVPTTQGGVEQPAYFNVVFKLGSLPFQLIPRFGVAFYAGWQPVQINVGDNAPNGTSAFFCEDHDGVNTLQWTNTAGSGARTQFGGWLVCQWWHRDVEDASEPGVQLFFRVKGYGNTTPSTCADVDLVPVYVP